MLKVIKEYWEWSAQAVCYTIAIIGIVLAISALSGCGHNVYLEKEVTGLGVDVPLGDASIGIVIGCNKTVRATVRGGASFETSSSNGGGLFSGAGGQSKITQFKSHAQLNEGNLVEIFTSTNCPTEAKVELAKNLSAGVNAPYFPGSILQTKESTIHIGRAAIQSNGVEQIQSKDPQGIDKLIDSTQKIIGNNVANDTLNTVRSVTHDVTNPAEGTIGSITTVVNDGAKTIGETGKSLISFAGVVIAAIIILIILGVIWTKHMGKYQHKTIKIDSDPDPDADFNTPSTKEEELLGDIAATTSTKHKAATKVASSSTFGTKMKNFFTGIVRGVRTIIGWFMLIPAPIRKQITDYILGYIKTKKAEYDAKKAKEKQEQSKKKK